MPTLTPQEFAIKWGKIQRKEMTTAYGWPEHLSDDDILERLLALNLARAAPSAN